jgi:hypothetical protein
MAPGKPGWPPRQSVEELPDASWNHHLQGWFRGRYGGNMQRYYFHIRQGGTLTQDLEGSQLANLDEAKRYAITSARELLAAKVLKGEVIDGDCFEIADESGQIALTVPLKSTIRLD